jgi:hypothetical protein
MSRAARLRAAAAVAAVATLLGGAAAQLTPVPPFAVGPTVAVGGLQAATCSVGLPGGALLLLGMSAADGGFVAYAVDEATGTVRWTFAGGPQTAPVACPPLGAGPLDGYAAPGGTSDGSGVLLMWSNSSTGTAVVHLGAVDAASGGLRWVRAVEAATAARLPPAAGGGVMVFVRTAALLLPHPEVLSEATGESTAAGEGLAVTYTLAGAAYARGPTGLAALWTTPGFANESRFWATLHTAGSSAVAGQVLLTLPSTAFPGCSWEYTPAPAPMVASRSSLWVQLFRSCDTPTSVIIAVALVPGAGMVQLASVTPPSADMRATYHAGSDTVLLGARQVLDAAAALGVRAYDATTGGERWASIPAVGSGGAVLTPAMDVWAPPPALAPYAPVLRTCCTPAAPATVAVDFHDPSGALNATWPLAQLAGMPAESSFLFIVTPSAAVVAAYVPAAGGPVTSLSASTRLDTPWVLSPPGAMAMLTVSPTTRDAVYWVGTPPGTLQLASIPAEGASPSGTASPSPTGSPTGTPTPPGGESPTATGSSSATGSPTGTPGPESATATATGSATPSPLAPGESPSPSGTETPTGSATASPPPPSDSPSPSATRPAVPLSPSPAPPPAPFRAIAQVPLPPGSTLRCIAPIGAESKTVVLLIDSPTDGGRVVLAEEDTGAVLWVSGPGSPGSQIGGPCPSADGRAGTAVSSSTGDRVYFTWQMYGKASNISFFIAVNAGNGRQTWQWRLETPSLESVVAASVMSPPPGGGLLLLLKSMLDGEPPRVVEVDEITGAIDFSLTVPMLLGVDTIERSATSARGERMALLLSRDDGAGQLQFSVATYDTRLRSFTARTVLPLPAPPAPPGCPWEVASDGSGLIATMGGSVWAHFYNPCDASLPSVLAGVAPDGATALPVSRVPASFTAYYHVFTETIVAGPVSVVSGSGLLVLDADTGVPRWPQAAPPSAGDAYLLDSAAVEGLNTGVTPLAANSVPAVLVSAAAPGGDATAVALVRMALADGAVLMTPSPLPVPALPGGGVAYRVYTTYRTNGVVVPAAGRATLLPTESAANGSGTSADWWTVQPPATTLGGVYWSRAVRDYAYAVSTVTSGGAAGDSVTVTLAFMPGPDAPTLSPTPAVSPSAAAAPGGGVPDAGAAVGGVFGVLAALAAAIVFFRWHAAHRRAAPLAAPGPKLEPQQHATVNLAARAASLSARTSAAAIGAPPPLAPAHHGGRADV